MCIELEPAWYLDRVYCMVDSIGEGSLSVNEGPSSVNEGLSSSMRSVQWNPSITDTFGDQHFVCFSKVSPTQGLLVYFW